MKEIKFRAWDKLHDKICNVIDIDFVRWNCKIIYDNKSDWEDTRERIVYIDSLDDIELLQYIGAKDKDGVEIYEGDIVKLSYPDYETEMKLGVGDKRAVITGVVMYSDSLYGFYVKQLTGDTYVYHGIGDEIEFYDMMGINFCWNELEVIGNMYENPLLMKDDKDNKDNKDDKK